MVILAVDAASLSIQTPSPVVSHFPRIYTGPVVKLEIKSAWQKPASPPQFQTQVMSEGVR
jgi:hypothetical protein